jgi:hypothetical protein
MTTELSQFSKWIPVISTLCGASVGLLGVFGTAHFNQAHGRKIVKEDRERKKLEEVYVALVEIDRDYTTLFGLMISRVHGSSNLEFKIVLTSLQLANWKCLFICTFLA